MSRADDDIDDEGLEGLSSLRSMFREMPDEEPPQRGLAELMAAARMKADEMAKPSLWERFLQALRRPQVMALATIMILIGGAVFISQRKSEMDASPTATQSLEVEALEKNAAPSAGSAMGVAQEAAKADSDKKEEAPGAAAPVAEPTRDERRSGDVGADGGGAAQAAEAESTRKVTAPTPKPATTSHKVSKPAPSKAPAKPRASSGAKSTDSDLLFEGGLDDAPAGAPSPDPAPAPAKPQPVAPTTSPSGPSGGSSGTATKSGGGTSSSAKTKQSTTLSVQQLHTNARRLAAAGDCAQVRTIAKQIAAKDAAYYRANIATDASLASCLK